MGRQSVRSYKTDPPDSHTELLQLIRIYGSAINNLKQTGSLVTSQIKAKYRGIATFIYSTSYLFFVLKELFNLSTKFTASLMRLFYLDDYMTAPVVHLVTAD